MFSNRRNVLRQGLALLGAGTAAVVIGGEAAAAPPVWRCCRDSSCAGTTCGGGTVKYKCLPANGCTGSQYCACVSSAHPMCYDVAC